MNNQTQEKTQNTIFYIPRLSEYADAIRGIMRELKNVGASPGQIVSLLRNEPEQPVIPKPEETVCCSRYVCKENDYRKSDKSY